MAVEHDAAAAEGVGEEAVGAGLGVSALDGEHPLGMREVPRLAAVALFEPGEHQLRAHRAVAEQRPFSDRSMSLSCVVPRDASDVPVAVSAGVRMISLCACRP